MSLEKSLRKSANEATTQGQASSKDLPTMTQATIYRIICLCAAAMVSNVAMAQTSVPAPRNNPVPQTGQDSIPAPAVAPEAQNLPPIPTGKSTVIGGEIRS